MSDGKFGLAEALIELRKDLDRVVRERPEGTAVLFEMKDVELEFTMVSDASESVEGGIKWYILSAGADVSNKDVSTQRIKMQLAVKNPETGEPLDVNAVDD